MLDLSLLDSAINVERSEQPGLVFDDSMSIPAELTDEETWANYVNDDLYEMDKALRAYLKRMRYVQERNKGFKTAVPLVFACLFGRKPEAEDSASCRMLHMLLRYYCESCTGKSSIGGVKYTKVYKFNRFTAKNKRPYSIRLRIEEANERGKGRPFSPYGRSSGKSR